MADKVKFLKGLQAEYDALAKKDESTFYYTTDTGRLYIGDKCISLTEDIMYIIDGGTSDVENLESGEISYIENAAGGTTAIL